VPRRAGQDPAGLGVYTVVVDITERKRAEAALARANEELEHRVEERTAALAAANERLRISERRLAAIFNATFEFIGLLDPYGRLIEANRTALDFGGFAREDVVGLPFWSSGWWSGDETRVENLKAAIARAAAGEFVRYEVEVQGARDTRRMIDFSLQPVRDEAGRVVLIIPEGRDITEKRRAEEAVRLSEARLRVALDATSGGMWDWNVETGDVFYSDSDMSLKPCRHASSSGDRSSTLRTCRGCAQPSKRISMARSRVSNANTGYAPAPDRTGGMPTAGRGRARCRGPCPPHGRGGP
jgi:PAS domain S-box-containing protein